MSETFGFIGLGNMGEPIAANLLRAGYALRVYNRTASKAAALAAMGVTVVQGPEVQSTNGTFYGTTSAGGGVRLCGEGGEISCGTVFSFGTGLGAFVATQPAMGAAGTSITILGNNLTGTTSVTFNGTLAAFQVKSKSWITATVPAGATTGTVQVVTPGGTLSSNVPFTVD